MPRLLKIAALSTAALCAAVVLFAVATLPPRSRTLTAPPTNGHPVIAGAYHVHTSRSDGTGTVDEVAAAAARAGLQFLILTDHGDGSRPLPPPTYRSGVLCIEGVEVSTWQGHYAVFGIRPPGYPLGGEARDVVEDVARLGGFGVAAHPESPKPALRWTDRDAAVDGIEWLNADSEWRRASPLRLAHALFEYRFREAESVVSIFSRPEAGLARWDDLTRHRKVVGLAALDAHARIGFTRSDPYSGSTALEVPSYHAMFSAFSLRVQLDRPLTGRAGIDAMMLRGALAAGHVYTAIDALARPPSFEFSARSGAFSAKAGDGLPLDGPVTIESRVNDPDATLVLLERGRVVAESRAALSYRGSAEPSVYRVEARLPSAPGNPPLPWIVSNPIYVGSGFEPRVAAVRAEAGKSQAVTAGPGDWTVERDARSQGRAGTPSPDIVALDYTLGGGVPSGQYVALTHAAPGLLAWDRLQFRARATRPSRMSVQLRAPVGPDGARWQRSFYLDTDPRNVTIFLDDMRPIGAPASARPDLARVDTLLLVVDTTNSMPGTSGRIEISEVRWSAPAAPAPLAGGAPPR